MKMDRRQYSNPPHANDRWKQAGQACSVHNVSWFDPGPSGLLRPSRFFKHVNDIPVSWSVVARFEAKQK
jgi:hypothetical protein